MNVSRQQLELLNVNFGQLLSWSNPYHLCLLCVRLESDAAYPWFNFLGAADKPSDSCPRIRSSSAEMDLCIIGIRVSLHVLLLDDIQQFCRVQKEWKWSKHGTLRDTVDQLHDGGQLSSECHLLRPVQEEGSYPVECWSSDAECALQPCQQDIMIDTVKRGTEIKQTEQRYLLLVHRAEKARDDPKQRSLGRMMLSIRRLFDWHQVVFL